MVIYEAAHAIVNMKRTTSRELAPAVSVLQLFCSSQKPTLRFAAVRTLNKVAMTHPAAVTACNLDLENLITGKLQTELVRSVKKFFFPCLFMLFVRYLPFVM